MRRRVLLFLFAATLFGIWIFWPGNGTNWIEVDVTQGKTGYDVATELRDKGLLRSVHSFLFWAKVRGAGAKLKVGRYRFSKGRSAWWIIDDLVNGRTQKIRVVIPEGFASWQVAERLDELKLANKDEFLKVVREKGLEGFLFPATYDLDAGYTAAALAQVFVTRFDKEWTADMENRAKSLRMTKKAVVTLASIIEREAMVAEERPIISSVYHNRLKKNMPLQADPTVQYSLGYWKQRLLYTDYHSVKSPYNTYLNTGLPPGPICSPGLPAIEAALSPAQTDYLYFVAAEAGHHTFSATYREHTNKVNKRNKERRQK
jgi:UPF0755 protein